jgi:cell division protein FtsI/penicillin-binding protein 2
MVSLKHLASGLVLMLIVPWFSYSRSGHDINSASRMFFGQSADRMLNRDFPNRDISFLLFDARSSEVLASRWEDAALPIPMGSLLKPFVALAYGQQHDFSFPPHRCGGVATGCWRPRGHGDVDLTSAIAYSCNSYFRALTANLTAPGMADTARRFDIDPPAREASGIELTGLGPSWRVSPLRMGRAYVELAHLDHEPGVSQILEGMTQSARQGTGAEVDRALSSANALVKTGTAQCTHSPRAPGDGFTVALFPADDPRILLMVRVHGVPGAVAAKTAGQMLRRIGD